MESQKAVTAYFLSKQLLPFGFPRQYRQVMCIITQPVHNGYQTGIATSGSELY